MLINYLIPLLVLLLFLAAFILVRTATFSSAKRPAEQGKPIPLDPRQPAEHLAEAIRCETVSAARGKYNRDALLAIHRFLEKRYPLVHQHLQRTQVAEYSLVYRWTGSQPDLQPVLLMAHLDVVPVDPATLPAWTYPPFDGVIEEGYIWGRGALDMKNQLVAIFEAVELLLASGYQPERDIFIVCGHDEEIGGLDGTRQIAARFREQNIRFSLVLDEGPAIAQNGYPGIQSPIALVATGEKGFLTLELSVECEPGHSSIPPRQTAIGILSRAITRLEEHPLPAHIYALKPFYRAAGNAAPFSLQLAFANLWLFGGYCRKMMESNPQTNAAIRTTTAPTIFNGGVKDNILPRQASAKINFRIMPGDTVASVCEHVRKTIRDPRVKFQPYRGIAWEASPVSSIDSPAFQSLTRIIQQNFGGLPVAPFIMLGATDSRHFNDLADQIFRFSPMLLSASDQARIHGIDERMAVDELVRMVQFFHQLLQSWSKPQIQ